MRENPFGPDRAGSGEQVSTGRPSEPWLVLRAGRWLVFGFRLLVVWWPLYPLVLAVVVFGPVGGLVIGAGSAAIAVGVSPWWRACHVRAWRRSVVLGWRVSWPRVCAQAGVEVVAAKRNRVPKLLGVELGPGWRPSWVRLELRPLGPHVPSSWDQIEDRLRRVTGHTTSQSWETEDGTLMVTLRRHRLPELVRADTARIGADESFVALGESADGGVFGWRPDEPARPHMIISGPTGGGKGRAVRLVLWHAAVNGWETIILNPKRSGEFGWCRGWASIVKSRDGMLRAVDRVFTEMMARQDVIEAVNPPVDHWRQVPSLHRRLLLVIDETAFVASMRGVTRQEADAHKLMMVQLAGLVSMGRSSGVHVVMITQHPIADAFGPQGSVVKTSCRARVVLGAAEGEGLRMMLGADVPATLAAMLKAGRPGRAIYTGLANSDGHRAVAGQVWLADDQQAIAADPRTRAAARPWDFDHGAEVIDVDDIDGQDEAA